ncbi:MAG: thioredoxin family protein [Candidatus Hydrogenedentes bacterium]|nr:thioredoxin family protein [Candidatus Hydrogenedentota bacterium]
MGNQVCARVVKAGNGLVSKIIIVSLLLGAIGLALFAKHGRHTAEADQEVATAFVQPPPVTGLSPVAVQTSPPLSQAPNSIPRLVDLGAGKCIPCKRMAPILEELKKDFAGQLEVQFIDVWENHDAAAEYGVRVIPTQVFYGADGKEMFRHEGFFSRTDILNQWQSLGVNLAPPTTTADLPAH